VKRRTPILFIAGLVFVVGVLFLLRSGQRGPLYDGKRASVWLVELARTEGKSDEAKRAFHEMGAQAVPYLVNELTNKSAFRDRYVAFKSKLPHPLFVVTPSWNVPHVNWQRRQYAATALGEIGPSAAAAIPALVEVVNQTEPMEFDRSTGASGGTTYSPKSRMAAIRALWKIGPDSPVVVSTVVAAQQQKYPDPTVGDAAIAALADLAPKFKTEIPAIIENLKYYDKKWPRPTVPNFYPVGGFAPGYAESVPRLAEALRDANPRTREAVAYDLGTLRPREQAAAKTAMPALIETLQDQDAFVCITVAEAIWRIDRTQSQATIPALVDLLSETNYTVRLRAIDLLRQMGAQATTSLPALEQVLNDEARIVQVWAAEALTQIRLAISNQVPFQ